MLRKIYCIDAPWLAVQAVSILGAPETAFSHFPGKAVTENPLVANGHATLVAGVQVTVFFRTSKLSS